MKYPNRTLSVFKDLWENTDDEHPATVADIVEYLATQGLYVKDYRTIQSDIADLSEFGVDIIETRKQRYEYHIGSRHFEIPEIKLLVDAVQSSRFISRKKSEVLIQKLSAFAGPHYARIINRHLYVDERYKSDNESVLRSVDAIQDAIADKKKVTFQYFNYTTEKEKIARHGGQPYVVSPYSLLWSGDNYYMVGHSEARGIVQTFRIDRIDWLSIVDESRIEPPEDYSVGKIFSQEFSMLSGKTSRVELIVQNSLIDNIIDSFGEDVQIEIMDSEHFKVCTTVELSTNFYGWIFASKGKIQLLHPQKAVDEFYSIIRHYQDIKAT